MKNVCKFRKFLAMVLAVAMSMAVTVPVFAAETTSEFVNECAAEDDYGIDLHSSVTKTVGANPVVFAEQNTPIRELRYEVVSSGYNGWVYQINIHCYDQNGRSVHVFYNASGVMASGTLRIQEEFGYMNVYRIDVSITPRLAVTPENYYKVDCIW